MKVPRQRVLWGVIFGALLALFAIVGVYVGRNLTGIGPIPVRSAFAGRLPRFPANGYAVRSGLGTCFGKDLS